MNVPQRIIYFLAAAVAATIGAIQFFPNYNFVAYVIPVLQAGFVLTLLLAALSFYREEELTMKDKNILMNGFLVAILVPSFYAAGAFMHESQTSWSGGEVHYHADFEILVEENGELNELDLVDPGKFCESTNHESSVMCKLNDRTGSKEYHEHNDDRVHLEGTFKKKRDASISAFFEQFNGILENGKLTAPTNDGLVNKQDSENMSLKILVNRGTGATRHWCIIGDQLPREDVCKDDYSGEPAKSPAEYVISPYSRGPNLDDIFIIYDSKPAHEALVDIREDNNYRGHGLTKEGSGYGG